MDGAYYADILFFAVIAAWMFFRLRSNFGKRNEDDSSVTPLFGQEIKAKMNPVKEKKAPTKKPVHANIKDERVQKKLYDIMDADLHFDLTRFLQGSKVAFEMVIKAFSEADKTTLKSLLSRDLYATFESELERREKSGEYDHTTLVSILSVQVTDASLSQGKAQVTVDFVSKQVTVTKDAEDNITDGDPSLAETVEDSWVFERDVKSSDPNWTIVVT